MPSAASPNPDSVRLFSEIHLVPATEGAALPSKFAGLAYSGGLAPSYGIVIDVGTTTIPPTLPLLSHHGMEAEDIVGLIDGASAVGSEIRVSGALFSDMQGSAAERYAQVAKRGVPLQMSVGLFGYSEEWIPQGSTANVNGQTFPGPVTVLRNGTIREVSLCTLGADSKATARLFSQPPAGQRAATPKEEKIMPTIEELQAQLAAVNTEKAALLADKTAAEAAAKATALAQRDGEISALFRECGTPGTDGERKALASLEPVLFAELASVKRASAAALRRLDPKLFAELATHESAGPGAASQAKTDADKQAAAAVYLSDPGFYGVRDAARRKAIAAGHFAG